MTNLPCSADLDLWFAEQPGDLAVAQARCDACPLATACLAGALERREPWGVWGGRIIVDGEVVATKRGRGRPRKLVAAS
ncbi:WhiB family transcriptional regulator [Nocardioides sp. C4-1]|uniref:WhiB family transcriptional regulator n=1 Tax=Nocardioides sp. C4-1 TaxID=3151851 RepID=UPI003267C231